MREGGINRRELLAAGAAALAVSARQASAQSPGVKLLPPICIFSKHLQWLSVPNAAALAAEIGFDGIDLTVRPGGHVEPARCANDLPKAVETIRQHGLTVPMVTTGIVDVHSSHAADILASAAALQIHHYRWGGFSLDVRRSIPDQIEGYRPAVKELMELNQHYGACAMYHTHSGTGVLGASIWDLYLLLRDFDSNAVSVNYDIAHATVEGGLGGWRNSASLVAPFIRGVALKDFYWEKSNGQWQPRWCPIGEGMVNFAGFFAFLRESHFAGPIQLHFEYPDMGGAEDGKRTLTISADEFKQRAARDLARVREMMRSAGLAQA